MASPLQQRFPRKIPPPLSRWPALCGSLFLARLVVARITRCCFVGEGGAGGAQKDGIRLSKRPCDTFSRKNAPSVRNRAVVARGGSCIARHLRAGSLAAAGPHPAFAKREGATVGRSQLARHQHHENHEKEQEASRKPLFSSFFLFLFFLPFSLVSPPCRF